MNEYTLCNYKNKDLIFKFTYNEFAEKPFSIYMNEVSLHCDEETFGNFVGTILENIEEKD